MTPAEFQAIREYLHVSQRWLAEALNVAERTVQRWEQPDGKIPDGVAQEVNRLRDRFDDEIEQMIQDAKQPVINSFGVGTAEFIRVPADSYTARPPVWPAEAKRAQGLAVSDSVGLPLEY